MARVSTAERGINARLIAAAPEMLYALREVVAEFDGRSDRAAEEQGCGGIADTGGISYARTIIRQIEGG